MILSRSNYKKIYVSVLHHFVRMIERESSAIQLTGREPSFYLYDLRKKQK